MDTELNDFTAEKPRTLSAEDIDETANPHSANAIRIKWKKFQAQKQVTPTTTIIGNISIFSLNNNNSYNLKRLLKFKNSKELYQPFLTYTWTFTSKKKISTLPLNVTEKN